MEKRRSKRVPLFTEVWCEGAGVQAHDRVSDIGLYGVFIDTLSPLPEGAHVRLSFTVPGGHLIATEGVVVHSQPTIGMGVKFTSISDRDVEYIRRLVDGGEYARLVNASH